MKKNSLLALLTGLLTALAYPPLKTGFLAYIALVPFYLLLENKTGRNAFKWGYISGLFIYIGTLWWLVWVTVPGTLGAMLALPLFFALYALAHTFLVKHLGRKALFFLPFLWVVMEYVATLGETSFPWNFIGYTQTYYLYFIQFAEFTAVYGVSAWVVAINVLFYLLYLNRKSFSARIKLVAALALLFILPTIYGIVVLNSHQENQKQITVAMVQGNIDPWEKWDPATIDVNYEKYLNLSLAVIDSQLDLLIWPETATPFYLRYEKSYLQTLRNMIDSTKTPLLTGSVDYEYGDNGDYLYFNSALGIEPKYHYIQHYAKMLLVPFSEKVPYQNYFPFNVLQHVLFDMQLGIGDYTKGDTFNVFNFKNKTLYENKNYGFTYKVAAAICYESVFPDHVRKVMNEGADFLTIITNDAWFGKTSAPFQHAQIAVFRAIENRTYIARCANSGISCFIDPYGRVTKQTSLFVDDVITSKIALRSISTFFNKFGNLFSYISVFISMIGLLASIILFIINGGNRKEHI